MQNARCRPAMFALLVSVLSGMSIAMVSVSDKGRWPASWPKELERYRDRARTHEVAHGIQENVHEIAFTERAAFEDAWPHILKVKSRGAPLILERSPSAYHVSGSTMGPGVRILASAEGATTSAAPPAGTEDHRRYLADSEKVEREGLRAAEALIQEGRGLRVGPPWPDSLRSADGTLPEYVQPEYADGKQKWVPADAGMRARVDIVLVSDGRVVDLNRIELPADTHIVDNRFKDAHDKASGGDARHAGPHTQR